MLAVLAMFSTAYSQKNAWSGIGVGAVYEIEAIGNAYYDNIGFTAKFWKTPAKTAIVINGMTDFNVNALAFYVAYNWYYDPFNISAGKLFLYHGPELGATIWNLNNRYRDERNFAIRFSWDTGVEYAFKEGVPVGIYVELLPTIQATFNNNSYDNLFRIHVPLRTGARYYF